MNSYEEKQEARKEYYLEQAEKARREFEEKHDRAKRMASVIPFGQPILVGHHSEKRDRNYRDKINVGTQRVVLPLPHAAPRAIG